MGEDREENEDPFLPMRLFYAEGADDRRARHEQARERQIAEHVSRRREHGGRPTARARGLSRADIVHKAVAIADAEGTGAVSMRRIAKDLQVGVMSLYWYIDSKDELHQLMLETVQAEIETADPSGDWRADLAAYARSTRAAVHRHPWAIDYIGAGPPSGPNDARNADQLIAALDGLGLDVTTTMWIVLTLGTYVMGAALREIQEVRWQRAADETMAEMTEAEIAGAYDEFERQLRGYGRYPHLAKVLDAGIDPDAPETRDERFEFGLSCLLDGIAARIKELPRSVTGTFPAKVDDGPALPDVHCQGCWLGSGVNDLANVPEPAVRMRLTKEKNVWLCTVRPDGSAHVTPVWFVYESSRWWIGADHSSVKVRNIQKESRVSLALEDGRFPVVAEGDASLVRDGFPREVVTAFERKYGWDVSAPTRPGGRRVLLEVRVRRWLLAGTAQ